MKNQVKFILIVFLILHSNNLMAQSNFSKVWVCGTGSRKVVFDNIISTYSGSFVNSYFSGGNSNICDSAGNLILQSDGFNIYDSLGNYILGGDTIVPKYHYVTKNGNSLYSQSSIFLSMEFGKLYFITPAFSDSAYFQCNNNGGSCFFDLLLYNIIDMNANNGQGAVTKRMIPLMQNASLSKTQMMACRHANGKDWWLLKQSGDSNIIYKFLFTQDSVYDFGFQKFIEPIWGIWDIKGQSTFSNDGTQYATAVQGKNNGEIFTAHFDRCSGMLSSPKVIVRPIGSQYDPNDTTIKEQIPSGLAYSPNGKFIYVCGLSNIYQFDIDSSTWYHVAGMDTSYQKFQDYLTIYQGNDDKLYIGNFGGTSKQMSRIDNPDVKGVGCNFCPRCLRFDTLGTYAYAGTPPCMPNYALGKDTSMCWPLAIGNEIVAIKENELIVYPNPANKIVNIKYKNTDDTQLEIINVLGQKVAEIFLPHNAQIVNSSVETLGNGVYNYRQTQNGKCINAGKLIIEN
jgi:hypothetical protein